jgi:molybdopterin-synthase adenylyltransferase
MKTKVYKTKPIASKAWAQLNFSQGKIAGFDLNTYQRARICLIGAGAIGSHVALGLVRKGIGNVDLFDGDLVELKNLTRQLFSAKDVGKNKAVCLSKSLSKQGFFRTTIKGVPFRFQEALEMGIDFSHYNAIICGVDNNSTRVALAEYCIANYRPLITIAVSRDGVQLYCAIQEPGNACFGCLMPLAINNNVYPCNLPGIIDVIQVVAGFAVYALDTVLMKRNCDWNLRMISLDGSCPETSILIPKRENCPLCGKRNRLKYGR